MQVRCRPVAATVTVLALAAVLTACFEDGPVTAPSGVKLPPTSMAPLTTAPSTTTRAVTTTTTRSSSRSSSSRAAAPSDTLLSDLRMGRRDGYDRLVLQFTGSVPAYSITRTAGPVTECGSGDDAGGPGEYLLLTAEPIAVTDDGGKPAYTGAKTVAGPGRAISRAIITCAFEGRLQVAVKLTGNDLRYTDSTLTGPSRIVLDVRE